MVVMEFSISPTGKSGSLAPYVARALAVIEASGLPYQLTAMGTLIEGEWDQVMAVVDGCFKALQADSDRIGLHMKLDWRAGPGGRLKSKVGAVEAVLGHKLDTGA